jgi:hypothetical protein
VQIPGREVATAAAGGLMTFVLSPQIVATMGISVPRLGMDAFLNGGLEGGGELDWA